MIQWAAAVPPDFALLNPGYSLTAAKAVSDQAGQVRDRVEAFVRRIQAA
jgi:hypothetical protein